MSEWKYTIFSNGNTNDSSKQWGRRAWGISESFYHATQMDPTRSSSDIYKLALARAALLPKGAEVVGVRVTKMDTKNFSVSYAVNIPSPAAKTSDYPTLALLAKEQTPAGNVMKLTLRALWDDDVEEGEWARGSTLEARWKQFKPKLVGFYQKVIDLNAAAADIRDIDPDGIVTLKTDMTLLVGQQIHILRSKGSLRYNHNGLYTIGLVTSARQFKIWGWEGGIATGGRARKHEVTTAPYTGNIAAQRIVSKKVGKPNFSFVGHR